MVTLTGRNTRTIVGYVVTLLDYPRWVIEREVDFTDCPLDGCYTPDDTRCAHCRFGDACRWLNARLSTPSTDAPVEGLLGALRASVDYLRSPAHRQQEHPSHCECDTCLWLREASSFLRQHRHRH